MARLPPALRGRPLDWGDDEAATRVQQDAASLSLVAREGPMAGHIFGTDGHAITIGRGSGCAVRLALSEISRQHAIVRYRAGRYWVEDLQTLNGTRVNQQLIDGPTPLKQGDRIRVGAQEFEVRFDALANREVVWDGPHSDVPVSVSTPSPSPRASREPVRATLSPLTLGAVAVLAITTGVLIAFAIPRQRSRTLAAPMRVPPPAPAATAANDAVRPPPPPAASTPIAAHIEMDGAVALTAPEAGTVRWAAARGTPVRSGDDLVRFRRHNVATQRELDRINARLEDDESNPELIRRAHALADELMTTPGTAKIKSDLDGVVIASSAKDAHLRPGVAAVRVARSVRLVVEPSLVVGDGSACRVSFVDQRLEIEGRRVVGMPGSIELSRFPETLSFDDVGRVRVDCK
jgi:FHA domain